jgi:hypothetical protein
MRDSPQPLIHLEAAVLQMATLEPGETLTEILGKLEALEKRLADAPAAPAGPGGRASFPAGPRAAQGSPVSGGVRTAGPGGPAGSGGAPPRAPQSAAAPFARPAAPPRASAAPPARFTPPTAPPWASPPATAPFSAPPPLRAPVAPRDSRPAAPADTASGPVWPGVSLGAEAPAATLEVPAERSEETERCWRAALAGINGRKRMLGAFLEESVFVGLSADAVVIGMDDLHRTVVEEKDNRALVIEEVTHAFGRALTLRCAPLESGPARRRPALEDVEPMVERAIEFFQGEAVEPKGRRTERTEA